MRSPFIRGSSRRPIYALGHKVSAPSAAFSASSCLPSTSSTGSPVTQKWQLTIKPAATEKLNIKARDMLLRAAQDDSRGCQDSAIEALGEVAVNDLHARDFLLKVAQDDNHRCQAFAILALGEVAVNDFKARDILLTIAQYDNHRCQSFAIQALGKVDVNDLQVRDILITIAQAEHGCSCYAIKALGKFAVNDLQVKNYILTIAQYDNHLWQHHAILALGEVAVNDLQAREILLKVTQDDNHRYQHSAIEALGGVAVKYPQAREILLKVAQDDNHRYQESAILILGRVADNDPQVRNFLLAIAQDDNHSCQFYAIEALGEVAVKYPQAREILLKVAQDDNHRHQLSAIEALGGVAINDLQVRNFLLAIAQNNCHKWQSSAIVALRALAISESKYSEHLKEILALAGRLTSFASRLRTRNGITIDRLLEGRHKGPITSQKSVHFEQIREYQEGDPADIIDANASARMGKMMVKESRRIANRNIMVVVDPIVLNGNQGDIRKKVATVAGMIAAVALRDGEQVGLVIDDNYYVPAIRSENQLVNILTAIYNSSGSSETALAPLLSGIFGSPIRQDFIPGSRAVIISDFSKPSQELEKSIKDMKGRRIEVTPVNIGNRTPTFPKPVIVMGGMEMEVHPEMVGLLCVHSAQILHQGQNRFLRANRGRQIDLSTLSKDDLPQVYARLIRPVQKEAPCSDYVVEGEQRISVADRSSFSFPIDKLTDPIVAANVIFMSKVLGSSLIFSLFIKMGIPFTRIGVDKIYSIPLASIFSYFGKETFKKLREEEYEFLIKHADNPFTPWEKIRRKVELEAFDRKSPFENIFPGSDRLRSPMLYKTFGPTVEEISEFSKRLARNLEQRKQTPDKEAFSLLSPNPEVSPLTSGADKEEPKRRTLAKISRPLTGKEAYIPMGIAVNHDSDRCSYDPSAHAQLDNLERGGGSKIKIRFGQIARPLVRILKPLGSIFIRQGRVRKKTVELKLAGRDPEFIQKLHNIPLSRFKELAPHILGEELFKESTQSTFAWEELDKQTQATWREVIEEAQTMSVKAAIRHIQNFVRSNYAYKQYQNVESLVFEEFKERAEKGQAAGKNEYLRLIVSLGGGKCAELAEITLALLRAAGLPAALFTGYVANGKVIDSESHRWAGVVLKDPDTGKLVTEPVETAVAILEQKQKQEQQIQEDRKSPDEVPKEESEIEHKVPENGNGELLEVERKVLGSEKAEQRYVERLWEGLTEDEQRFVEQLLLHLGLAQRAKSSGAYFLSVPVSEMIEDNIEIAAGRQKFENQPVFPPAPLSQIISYWHSLDERHRKDVINKIRTRSLQRFVQVL